MSGDATIPIVCATGSNYECGLSVGRQMGERIRGAFARPEFLKIVDWAQQTEGAAYVAASMIAHERNYPHLMEEVRGLAEGADVPFLHAFLRNMEGALMYPMRKWDATMPEASAEGGAASKDGDFADHCTDYMRSSSSFKAWGHTEDGSPSDQYFHYVIHQEVTGLAPARFTAYAYAGMLPGWAWGFNTSIGFSINALFPKPAGDHEGDMLPSIEFVCRDVLGAHSIEEALERARVAQAVGASYNMGEWASRRMVNFEVLPGTTALDVQVSLVEIAECPDGVHVHANTYKRIDAPRAWEHHNEAFRVNSAFRVRRGYEMPVAENVSMIRDVLRDEFDPQGPIFNAGTLASVIFDVEGGTCSVWDSEGTFEGCVESPQLFLKFANAGSQEQAAG